MLANGAPNELLLHIFVGVLVDVAGGGHTAPRNVRMAVLDLIAKPARGFRNDMVVSKVVIEFWSRCLPVTPSA